MRSFAFGLMFLLVSPASPAFYEALDELGAMAAIEKRLDELRTEKKP
jgi:hypothetical protein